MSIFVLFNILLVVILVTMLSLIIVYRIGRMGQLREQRIRLASEAAIIKQRLALIAQRIEDRRTVLQSTLSELEKRRRDPNNTTTAS